MKNKSNPIDLNKIQHTPGAPPQDGREYLCFGNLMQHDEYSVCAMPFCEILHFADGLWLDRKGLSITWTLEDGLHFHAHLAVEKVGLEFAERVANAYEREDGQQAVDDTEP